MSARFDGLSWSQEFTLGQIAMGITYGHNPRTIASLLRRGLIVEETVSVPLDDLGTLAFKVYAMPIHEHMRWCAWCAEHCKDAERSPVSEGARPDE